jgi:hypothetical protein
VVGSWIRSIGAADGVIIPILMTTPHYQRKTKTTTLSSATGGNTPSFPDSGVTPAYADTPFSENNVPSPRRPPDTKKMFSKHRRRGPGFLVSYSQQRIHNSGVGVQSSGTSSLVAIDMSIHYRASSNQSDRGDHDEHNSRSDQKLRWEQLEF